MANVSFHLGTSTPGTSGLTAGGIYVNSSTGGIWYATSTTARVPLGFDAPITTAGTGAAYTATVGHILSLTAGASFVIKPHATATSTSPTLNVNSLGAKTIKRRLSNGTSSTAALYATSNIYINKPVRVTYDGTYWILEDLVKPVAADLYGTVAKGSFDNSWDSCAYTAMSSIPSTANMVIATLTISKASYLWNENSTATSTPSGQSVSIQTMLRRDTSGWTDLAPIWQGTCWMQGTKGSIGIGETMYNSDGWYINGSFLFPQYSTNGDLYKGYPVYLTPTKTYYTNLSLTSIRSYS